MRMSRSKWPEGWEDTDAASEIRGDSADWKLAHLAGIGAVAELEAKLRALYGAKYALCVANATQGLLAVAQALGLRNQEFITTPYTYGATLSGWLFLGNRPVFADVDPMTLTLCPKAVSEALTPETKAILAVDIHGVPADATALRSLADEYGLWYVSDGAQSLGASRDGRAPGALADANVVSFTVGKTVFAGEGGAVLTNRCDLYEKLIWQTQHPQRQARELGLSLTNQFSVNARINPLGALYANATFERSLRRLALHQEECLRLVETMNGTGLIEPIDFDAQRIKPAFFRLTAAWKGRPQHAALAAALGERRHARCIATCPGDLVYRDPAFVSQYRFRVANACAEAERQRRKRFAVLPTSHRS